MSLLPAVTQPSSLVEVDNQCALVEEWADQCDSVPELQEATHRLAAIDEYLSRTSTEGRARVAASLRRLEVRIGELRGPAELGTNQHSEGFHRDETLTPQERHAFRQMAEHPEVVERVIEESTDADPPSRRKVMAAIKNEAQQEPTREAVWHANYLNASRALRRAEEALEGVDIDKAIRGSRGKTTNGALLRRADRLLTRITNLRNGIENERSRRNGE